MVVIAHDNWAAEVANELQTLVGTSVVADHIPSTKEISHSLRTAIIQHDLERIKVRVNISENGESFFHAYFNKSETN